MEEITHAFGWLHWFIEWFNVLIAIAGVVIAFRGYKVAGLLIALGSVMHAIGYYKTMAGDSGGELEQLDWLLISFMYPGMLLHAVGIFYLAISLRHRA
ncbi:hypothetical protein [Arenimonas aestuarii]